MAQAPKKAATTKAAATKQETYMPTDTDQQVDILDEVAALAHALATEGKVDEAALLTRITTTVETLRKEVRQQQVMVDYQEQCKTLAEDKLRQFLLS